MVNLDCGFCQHVNVIVDDAWAKQTGDQISSKWMIEGVDLPEAQQDNALKLHYFLSSCESPALIQCKSVADAIVSSPKFHSALFQNPIALWLIWRTMF